VTALAVEFRQQFKKDVVVDIICFRKLGHNEQDEPMVTQPLMYKKIGQHPATRKLYADRLEAQGVLAPGDAEQMIKDYRAALDECPDAEFTGMALEFGTLPLADVLAALRGDQWLANHPGATAAERTAVKGVLRDAFYVDRADWKAMVWAQARVAVLQALGGLSR
jgi:hypothetical protein